MTRYDATFFYEHLCKIMQCLNNMSVHGPSLPVDDKLECIVPTFRNVFLLKSDARCTFNRLYLYRKFSNNVVINVSKVTKL